ncbi:MAG TPA: polyphosphate kinase 2 family protein [Pseudolysinimonas sp.]|nr:polyphosphate kinase 2 family protein [Pseudolysinimonas sp.]
MKLALRAASGFDLSQVDPDSTPGFDGDKKAGSAELASRADELAELQEKLFASGAQGGQRSLLLVIQAMDTAGKGGIVKHVVGSVNPQGVDISSFKAPTDEEKAHDFLWRIGKQLPIPGRIGVFDRSHYEDVLIHRVRELSPPDVIEKRYGEIVDFEKRVRDSGTEIVKVMLHISPEQQKKRLAARLDSATKRWKYNPGDLDERCYWGAYMEAYQIAIERTSTAEAPWYVVPGNHKWFGRLAVQHLLLDALRSFDLRWPAVDYDIAAERERLARS